VLEPWLAFYIAPPGRQITPEEFRPQVSLYVLLDLADFLQENLPSVFDALGTDGSSLKEQPNHVTRSTLFDTLHKITTNVKTGKENASVLLTNTLQELKAYLPLVRGEGSEPPSVYDLSTATGGISFRTDLAIPIPAIPGTLATPAGQLYTDLQNALNEEKGDNPHWLKPPSELAGMIKTEPDGGDSYYLRLVYEHAPCSPVVSEPSQPFIFAKVFDPDAPARQIRIELPSIAPKDLRKFKRGVGLQMSPALSNLLGRVNPGMLQGQGLDGISTGVQVGGLAVICAFSIPIITLLALIVMFIFLLLFNIIFWWLPFIMICFPIPRPKR
jgi:hypothetical protein